MINLTKKIIACFCVAILLLFNVYAEETQETYNQYSQAITFLKELGIFTEQLTEYENLGKEITRGQGAQYITELLAINTLAPSLYFSDVPKDHPNYSHISAAVELGIISGHTSLTFQPDKPIKPEELVKMLVCAINYKTQAEAQGGYPTGYLAVAISKGLLKNVDISGETVTQAKAIQLLSNTLTTDMLVAAGFGDGVTYTLRRDVNILSQYHQIVRGRGLVTGNYFTRLTAPEGIGTPNRIEIEGEIYFVKGDGLDLLGYYVEFYYSTQNETRVPEIQHLRIMENMNNVAILEADNIIAYQDNILTYDQSNRQIRYRISRTKDVIYNGKLDIYARDKDFTPNMGRVVLIDNNNDGVFDIAIITSYTNYYVKSVSTTDSIIYDKYGEESLSLETPSGDMALIYFQGQSAEFSDIRAENVVSIAKSRDGESIVAHISENSVVGTVSEVGEDYVIIKADSAESNQENSGDSGVKYQLAKNLIDSGNLPRVGDSCEFRQDFQGKIAGYTIDSYLQYSYGYVIAASESQGVDKKLQIKLLNDLSEVQIYQFAPNVTLNETTTKQNADILNAMRVARDGTVTEEFVQQVVRYRLNGNGEINWLQTAAAATAKAEDGLKMQFALARRQYQSSSMAFNVGMGVSGNTVVFVVPYQTDIDRADDEDYQAKKPGGTFSSNNDYNVEGYDGNELGIVNVVVRYVSLADAALGDHRMVGLMDRVSNVAIEAISSHKIYFLSDGKEMALPLMDKCKVVDIDGSDASEQPLKDVLKRGMVFRYNKNINDQITSIQIIVDLNQPFPLGMYTPDTNRVQQTGYVSGIVYSKTNSYLCVKTDAQVEDEIDYNKTWLWPATKAGVHIYDKQRDKVYLATNLNDVREFVTSGSNASRVYARFNYAIIANTFIVND